MGTKDNSVWFSARCFFETPAVPFSQGVTNTKLLRTRVGTSKPNWRKLIQDHQNATTPLDGTFQSCTASPGYCRNRKTTGIVSWRGDLAAYAQSMPGAPTISVVAARERAVRDAIKQIRKAQIQMQGGVFIGELREAMHMLRHPAEALGKALKETYLDKLKRIKKKNPKTWRKAIPQTWLEASFGWLPFVNDLQDAGQAYQSAFNDLEDRFAPIRGVGKDIKHVDEFNGFTAFPVGENLQSRTVRRTWDDAVCIIRGQVKAQANATKLDKLRCFGLTPTEFIPTVWELLPWSFLVDYFSNIGDILEHSVTDLSSLAWASEDQIVIRSRKAMYIADLKETKSVQGPTFVSLDTGDPSHVVWKYRTVKRILDPSLNIPPLRFEIPGRPTQHLNMVALWAQAYYDLHPQRGYRR